MPTVRWYQLLLVCATLVVAAASFAQDKALITGDVVNQQDVPIPGVHLTLRNDSLGISRTTTSDSDGTYFFAALTPADGYIITATADSPTLKFTPGTQTFSVSVGENREMLPPFIAELQALAAQTSPKAEQPTPAPSAVTTPAQENKAEAQPKAETVPRPTQPTKPEAPTQAQTVPPPSPPTTPEVPPQAETIPKVAPPPQPEVQAKTETIPETVPPATSPPPPQQEKPPTVSPPAVPSQAASNPPSPAPSPIQAQTAPVSRTVVLDTLSTSMSTVVTREQLRTLPLYNRNFLALGLLSISTHDVQAGSTLAGASFSISGQQPTANDFLLDGMKNLASSNNQAIPFQVNDAIQEFRVVYANPDAQFGRDIGGAVNVVTQRGTSNFHGSVFGFFGSDSLNANSPLSVYGNSGFDQAAAYAGALNSAPAPAHEPFGQPIYQPTTYNQYVATVKSLGTQNCTTPGATLGSLAVLSDVRPSGSACRTRQPLSTILFSAIWSPCWRIVSQEVVLVRRLRRNAHR